MLDSAELKINTIYYNNSALYPFREDGSFAETVKEGTCHFIIHIEYKEYKNVMRCNVLALTPKGIVNYYFNKNYAVYFYEL